MKVITSIDIYLPGDQIWQEKLGADDVVCIDYKPNDALITIYHSTGKDTYFYGMQCKYLMEEIPNDLVISYVVAKDT